MPTILPSQVDPAVRELGQARLLLRGDLVFTPQTSAAPPYYLVEDPLNSRFFRLGQAEYTFVSLLDGRTTIQEALSHLSTVMPTHRLTEHEAAGLCRWLVEMDLAHTGESSQAARLARNAGQLRSRETRARLHPLALRVPLFRPDRVFTVLATWLSWLYSPAAFLAWIGIVAIGGYTVLSNWERFETSAHGIFAPANWLWLAACWIVLKTVHEVSHGVVCKRYGGHVPEMGLLFVLLAPLAYVDVTSSWRFRSRRQRMHVAAAGMYIELMLASLAAIVWSRTESGWLQHFCFNATLMASATTVLFNANPLMKFDGYFLLSDALSMPNLYTNGQHYLRYFARRYLLGVPAALPAWPQGHGKFIRIYAWASFTWRLVVCLSLIISAAAVFQSAGLWMVCVGLACWLGLPAFRLIHYLAFGMPSEQPNRLRFVLTVGSLTAIVAAFFGLVPWPGARAAPAVVEYAEFAVVRAASAGFVQRVLVASDERVEKDQVLLVLENEELRREAADLELRVQQSEIRGRQHEQRGERAAQQAEANNREALLSELTDRRSRVEGLTVRAPRDGQVIGRNLPQFLGTYLEEGDEVCAVGEESDKELRLSLSQDDLEDFARQVGAPVQIDIARQPVLQGRLQTVIPRATLAPVHAALAATNGGPLPVKPIDPSDESQTQTHQLLSPHFAAIVDLDPSNSGELRSGQAATVTCQGHESIGGHLYHSLTQWVRSRLGEG